MSQLTNKDENDSTLPIFQELFFFLEEIVYSYYLFQKY